MTILVTGANGFIGSHLVDVFLERGCNVRCLVRPTADLRWLEGKDVEIRQCPALDEYDSLVQALRSVNVVVHAAGTLTARTPVEYDRINAEPVRLLLDACRKSGNIERFLLLGSQGAAGPSDAIERPLTEQDACRPVSAYGRSKLKSEELTRQHAGTVPFTIVRPSAVYGPRDVNLQRLFKTAGKTGKLLYFGGADKALSLVHVRDLALGVYAAALSDRSVNETYFLASERSYSLEDVSAALASAVGRPVKPVAVPELIRHMMMAYADVVTTVFGKQVLLNRDRLSTLNFRAWTCDVSKARQDFGFHETTSLADGFRHTYEWYRAQRWL